MTQQQIVAPPTISESPNTPGAHNPISNNADNPIEPEINIPPHHNDASNPDSTPDVQPDAEPAHGPTAPQTPANNSTPDNNPSADNIHLSNEIPRGGLDVELPTTDEEGLNTTAEVRDHWTLEGSQLIRHHRRPRRCLCCPIGLDDIPIPADWLTDARETHVETSHGLSWVHQDLWRKNILAHQSMPMTWTGKTVFTIKEESLPDCPSSQQYAALCHENPARGYELALTLDTDEILQCSRQSDSDQVAFLASSAKKQRSEVKEKDLSPSEKTLFQAAKTKEIVSWLSTETVRKITRSQIPEEQILRSRWVLTWKPAGQGSGSPQGETDMPKFKPKARLVILGFEDPQIETLARDSPTLGKDSRTLILQYAASARWKIQSFDIQTAFLRGRRQDGRILGMDPPSEMREHMNLKPWECCELLKSAYGLVNATLLWYEELKNALLSLNFVISPLDPCLFALS